MSPILPTSLRIPKPLKAKLIAYARAEKRPLSVQIVYVLEQWVTFQEQQAEKKKA